MRLVNELAVQAYLMPKIFSAVEYMFEQIEEFNKQTIQQVVYDSYQSEWYERTMEFKDAWGYLEGKRPQTMGKTVTGTWGFRSDMLTYNPDLWQHGSYYGGDRRASIADFIYNGVTNSMFGDIPARDAWTVVTTYVTKQRIKDWIVEGLERQGLTIV